VEIRVEQNKEQAKTGEAETGQKGNDTLDKAQELLEKSRRVLQEEGDEADENSEDEDVRERLFNLWTTMDPHSNQGIRPAPFKKGKTYRIPASLEQSDTKNGKGRSKKEQDPQVKEKETLEETSKDETMAFEIQQSTDNLFKVKGPYLPEFNYLYLREMKRRVKERKMGKNAKSNKRKAVDPPELDLELVEEPAVIDAIEKIASNTAQIEPATVQAAVASTSGLPHPSMGDEPDLSSDEEDAGWNAEPMAFDEEAVHRSAAAAQGDPGGEIIQSYEDLCRSHIENYLASAESFVIETSLTKRVADWKAKLEPILSRQEEAKPFDIHSYGENLITRFQKVEDHPVSTFRNLVNKEEEVSEVCRLFAATLQLANHGNVEILPDTEYTDLIEEEDERMHIKGSFSLKLISSTLVTFETNNNINIAVLQKKLGEGDDVELGRFQIQPLADK